MQSWLHWLKSMFGAVACQNHLKRATPMIVTWLNRQTSKAGEERSDLAVLPEVLEK